MFRAIQKENEIICPCGCGYVLATVEDSHKEEFHGTRGEISSFTPSANIMLLGSALEKKLKQPLGINRQYFYEETVLRQLTDLAKEYALPEVLAIEAFNAMKKKKSGFRSETEPIKEFLKILSKDDNYIYIRKYKMIKARYEKTFNK